MISHGKNFWHEMIKYPLVLSLSKKAGIKQPNVLKTAVIYIFGNLVDQAEHSSCQGSCGREQDQTTHKHSR